MNFYKDTYVYIHICTVVTVEGVNEQGIYLYTYNIYVYVYIYVYTSVHI
jgi:hypothetical protein